ncbi:MAG: bifunctional phosphoribosylaminoimidazolecarboxamide formyltransferase/IMP cyclohydrolase [Deltaproteobacteria bacterium]|nr:bifunctional phosphoribosylaminoimidazolecarboxamide formyltransferase/IMP cyclohydrolase [Deltaproteobacteria bacterium]
MPTVSRALISVSDKRGVVEFARGLTALGIEILSTGGTAKALTEAGVPVVPVENFTGFPEMLNGRVKTLHPRIHAGILHRRDNPSHQQTMAAHGLKPIDLVVVNLYPFEQTVARPGCTFAEAVENIDIGGPSLLRAAAKNHADVGVVVDPDDYPAVFEALRTQGALSAEQKLALAKKAFRLTARYDGAIADYLGSLGEGEQRVPFGETLHLQYVKVQDLRYGENPHQAAAFYRQLEIHEPCIANARQLQGKELSFNNIVDANAAFELLKEFDEIAAVAIKHTNPCGVAMSTVSLADAFRKTRACDPVSIFGGIVGLNREVDAETAQEILNLYQEGFIEILLAPGFSPQALEKLASSKRLLNIRLMEIPTLSHPSPARFEVKHVVGGMLLQERDFWRVRVEDCQVVTQRRPTPEEYQALAFAWRVSKHVKSNAIVLARSDQVVGVGAGQMSRVDAAKIAVSRAQDLGLDTRGTVVASDAFFPFRDGLDVVARAGATAAIQPGGSLRDKEVIAAADEQGLAMVFTGMRHFRH